MMRYFLLALLVGLCTTLAVADPRSEFDEGLRLYRENDMTGAIRVWEQVASRGVVSGELLYNLGNAYYREGNVGRSVLMFERARKLMPRDRDVHTNLDLARMATVDRVERPVRLMIWNWIDAARDFLSMGELARLFQTLGFLLIGSILAWRLGPLSLRSSLKTLMLIFLVLYGWTGAWYGWRAEIETHPSGVVLATKTDAYSAPDAAATQLFSLHEGTWVRTGETLSGWVNIRLADGRAGWIPVGDVERI
jgi:hypothetical protein